MQRQRQQAEARRRQKQQQFASSKPVSNDSLPLSSKADEGNDSSQVKAGGGVWGFLGSLLRSLTGADKAKAQIVSGFGPAPTSGSLGSNRGGGKQQGSLSGSSSNDSDDESSAPSSSTLPSSGGSGQGSSGMYLHGAVMLVLHGDVRMDTITSMGYRAPSNHLFRVETLARYGAVCAKVAPPAVM